MELVSAKQCNVRLLSWEIRKALNLNLGGFADPTAPAQIGGIRSNTVDGTIVTVPDGTALPLQLAIVARVVAHNPLAPLPADFPPDPPVIPTVPLLTQFDAAIDVAGKLAVLRKLLI